MESKSGWAMTAIRTLQIREFRNTWFYEHNALQIQSCISKTRHGWNRRVIGDMST
ncbi:hypothetical protein Hanom_Chr07g00623991 [Helianthus anomalus]